MVKVLAGNMVTHFNASDNLEALVTPWLENLLRHFGIHELQSICDQTSCDQTSCDQTSCDQTSCDQTSDQTLVALLARCRCNGRSAPYDALFQDSAFLAHLKHRIVALAGAQLDNSFLAMAPDVIEEEETEAISLTVDVRSLQGVRYQGEVYRLVDKFLPCHRLQAFCLGHTLNEQRIAHIMTRSPDRFAVWVNVRAMPHSHYHSHLPDSHLPTTEHLPAKEPMLASENIVKLGC
jgi:hypothetical protein